MKANEYFKKHGYKKCKAACAQNGWLNTGFWIQLKRLIKSHELVESHGGLPQAREVAHKNCFDYPMRLLQAVADVESCK